VSGTFDRPIYGLSKEEQGEDSLQSRAVDGRYGYQFGTAQSHDPSESRQHITVDLDKQYAPDTIVLLWWENTYPEEYRIMASRRKQRWDVLKQNLDAGEAQRRTPGGLPVQQQTVRTPSDTTYRYIRVEIPKGNPYYSKYPQHNFVSLVELKVFPRNPFRYIRPRKSTINALIETGADRVLERLRFVRSGVSGGHSLIHENGEGVMGTPFDGTGSAE
jgi:hypothetical protein